MALVGVLCLVGAGGLGACSSDSGNGGAAFSAAGADDAEAAGSELSARLHEQGLESLASALDVIDIGSLIDSPEFTLLAPSDEAFQSMDPDEMSDLLADPENLLDVLRNHVLDEQLLFADMVALGTVRTEAGKDLTVAESDGMPTIGGAGVTSTDLTIDDVTVHVVDQIFVP